MAPDVMSGAARCIGCRRCASVCSYGVAGPENLYWIDPTNAFKEEFLDAEFARKLHNVDTIHVLPYYTLGENRHNFQILNYEEVNYEFRSIRND